MPRVIEFQFLNKLETEFYLELLNGNVAMNKLSLNSCFNVFKQLDYHLIKDKLPILKNYLLQQDYTTELYTSNREYNILSKSELAQLYVKKSPDLVVETPSGEDEEFWTMVMKYLCQEIPENIWPRIRVLSENYLETYLGQCVPKYSLRSLHTCIDKYFHDSNLMVFIKHTLKSWI